MKFKTVICLILFNSFFSSLIFAQDVGKIFTAEQANVEFGVVFESKQVPTSTVKNWLNSTEDKIMFRIIEGELIVLGDNRDLVYSPSEFTDNNQIFHMYSKSKVEELIIKGEKQFVLFENRSEVFSVTCGNITLEASWPCPPYCN